MKYLALSPDGLPCSEREFSTQTDAMDFIGEWSKRYAQQGYYADSYGNRISVRQIPEHCSVVSSSEFYE